MRLDGLNLNDAFVARLLAAFETDPGIVDDPAALNETVGTIALYALERMATEVEGETASGDRRSIERLVADLAGRRRMLEVVPDRIGVPVRFWTEGGDWVDLDAAPAGAVEVETLLDGLAGIVARHPGLRVLATQRLLDTDEPVTGVMVARAEETVPVVVTLGGRRHRLRVAPEEMLLFGLLAEEPELLPEERR